VVDLLVNAPSRASSLDLQDLLLLCVLSVLLRVSSHVNPSVQNNPVSLIVGSLDVPVHHNVGRGVPVSEGVDGREEGPAFSKVEAEEGVGLVLTSGVGHGSSDEILELPGSDGRAKGLDLTDEVRVLPDLSLSTGSQVEEESILVHIVREVELKRQIVLSLVHLGVERVELRRLDVAAEVSRVVQGVVVGTDLSVGRVGSVAGLSEDWGLDLREASEALVVGVVVLETN
jgi:hypothetical protein